MGAYSYQAMDAKGKAHKGVIDADSSRHARQLLRDMHLIPVHINAQQNKKTMSRSVRIKHAQLSLLTRQLATLLAAGIPLDEALQGVAEQTEEDKVRGLILSIRSKVLEGYSLAQAMNAMPDSFPELYRATVSAGEQTGRLDVVLNKLADYTEHRQAARQKVMQALIYPVLMIVVSVGIISFLLAFVVPKIIDVFAGSGQTLPPMTQILLNISEFFQKDGIYFLIFLIIMMFVIRQMLKQPNIRYRWHQILLRLPITKYIIKTVNSARYIHTFGILFQAGVPVLDTMRVSTSLITNMPMHERFEQAVLAVREGGGISKALKDTGFINPMCLHLISSGEKSGQIPEMMERAASHLDEEIKRLVDTALTLLEPLVILFMGAVVLFIVLATLLPVFSMEQLVS